MKIFIIGASGGVGHRLAPLLNQRGHEVVGLYRKPQQATLLRGIGVTPVAGDLVQMDAAQLAETVRGSDAIVFSAGAGDADNDAMTTAVDGDGVVKAIEAAELAGIHRFLLVSVFPEAWRERRMDRGFEHYIAVKKRADVALSRSKLDWVILRPSALKNEPGTGTVSLGVADFHTQVRRDDLAATLAELIDTPAIRRQILELTEGDVPIKAAVAAMIAP